MRAEVEKPWQEHNIDSIYLLYLLKSKFSTIINKKFLREVLGSDDLCSKDTFSQLCNILLVSYIQYIKATSFFIGKAILIRVLGEKLRMFLVLKLFISKEKESLFS